MTKPIRVQLSRRKGWRMPKNTVKVDRTSRWGNPWRVRPNGVSEVIFTDGSGKIGIGPRLTVRGAVDRFRRWMMGEFGSINGPFSHPLLELVHCPGPPPHVSELRGKNLACWCPLDQPCHADVLLELANGDPS